ncbi:MULTISPECIES: ImmA/IrrE family metallo-endopeptidase [Corynebacterium]|uniref:ImmA/IrrE family metallo-endopeptidase n=1 Tax=Corynebacterium TaxID=1716 RepID=UPI0003B8A97E|nr:MULTISPECIES: ImmA/IrrE family metallo-endopeptidase [Corynebacterium]ERS53261.1 hypothetical protein HMPREF1267_01190 [Corynebacterium sp. KPL1824]MDK4268134.1 ImmA/IrrE family metallo-endopeptidase [Corynebacterium accolens]MDK8652937.1 ImmA/IrrE family metallo-endopeptidase [Corynebacterium accolens]WKS57697.1 ImmA/IrrE family metallo-endopeptidase [Corynebacterium accolens]
MSSKSGARNLRAEIYNVNGRMRMPIDVHQMARDLNIEIVQKSLPAEVAGFILKEARDEFPTIYVNAKDGPQRQRFTIAHELGHYVQERTKEQLAYVDNRNELASTGVDPQERWCNAFAAELIMPEASVKKYWAEGWSFEEIRTRLDVSKAALTNRLASLRLI